MAMKQVIAAAGELENADLGDPRRSRRLGSVARAMEAEPSLSLPKALGNDSALEGAYRLLNNKAVTPAAVLRPHVEKTVERAVAAGSVYVVSDSTEVRFGGEDRDGLGPLQGGGQGFLVHVGLCVASDGSRLPLGVLCAESIVRPEVPKGRRGKKTSRKADDRESLKWLRGATAAEKALGGRAAAIHVMDREADIYELLAKMVESKWRFIVRVAQNRKLDTDDQGLLFDALDKAHGEVSREIPVTQRRRATKGHPARSARTARLTIAATTLTLRRPTSADRKLPETISVNFVRVFEASPPNGEPAIEWKLATTEPVDTQAQLEAIVDGYRTRWVIEEFFKALKTGCSIEQSQLESLPALLNLLSIKLPIAAQLLALRTHARTNPQAPASAYLSSTQLQVLRAMSKQKLPVDPTVEQALLAVAAMGGHIKNNGAPGWIVLWRGFEDLHRYVAAWDVFQAMKTSDQS